MTHLVYHKNIFKTLVTFKYTIQTLNCEADIYTSILGILFKELSSSNYLQIAFIFGLQTL